MTDVMRFFWRCAGRAVGLNLARLAAVKSKYDSANVFRVNQTSCRPRDRAGRDSPTFVDMLPVQHVCLCETPPLVVLSHMDNGGFRTLADEVTNVPAHCCNA